MFDTIFDGHFATVTDTHPATDPWGLGITVDVLRADHQDAKDWDKEHGDIGTELWEEVGVLASKAAVRSALMTAARPGMRQQPKQTKAEQERADTTQGEREDARVEMVVQQALDSIPDEKIGSLLRSNVDVNSIKPKVAHVLMRGWAGVKSPGGEVISFNLHNALKLLGWEGALVEYAGAKQSQFIVPTEAQSLEVEESSDCKVTYFTGNPRKADGSLWTCPAGMKYGPAAVGDAITRWLLEESGIGTVERAATLEKSADFLADTPPGSPDTSETVQ